ncbi:unnamed protein product [Euphydryas editha]|nr:unnamed protein product [Euphydryas editha]
MEVNNADDSTEELALEDNGDRIMEESQNSDTENFEESRRLDAVTEDTEPEDDKTPQRPRVDNPLEGPSWLLDEPRNEKKSKSLTNFEPDSTTEFEENVDSGVTPGPSRISLHVEKLRGARCEFSPTVRRRRASPPPASPRSPYSPRPRRPSNNGRILKVLVAKMRLDEDEGGSGDVTPPKRPNLETKSPIANKLTPKIDKHPENSPRRQSRDESPRFQIRDMSPSKRLMRFDAPSPNGSTDSRVIVLENRNDLPEPCSSGVSRMNRLDSQDSHNSLNNNHNNSNHNQSNDDTRTNHSIDNRNRLNSQSRDNHTSIDNRNRLNSQSRDNRSVDNSNSRDSRDSDSSGSEMANEGRTRRPRKAVVYKEKPLNR